MLGCDFAIATKQKEKLFLLCTLPWHYKVIYI